MKDNQQLCSTVEKLTEERRQLQERLGQLESNNRIVDDPVARVSSVTIIYIHR